MTCTQVVLGTLILHHIYAHSSLLTGLNAPYASLYTEPDMHCKEHVHDGCDALDAMRWMADVHLDVHVLRFRSHDM